MISGRNAVRSRVLALCCFLVLIRVAESRVARREVAVLQQIVTSMGVTSWKFNARSCKIEGVGTAQPQLSWSESNVECDCNVGNSTVCHIVGIVLKGLSLPGVLPPKLVELPYVQHIDFAYNYLSGTIPTEWASTKLNYISVLVNRLSGEIPKALGNITSLTYLNLEGNQFSGAIPSELGNLVNLQTLMLSSNSLVGRLPASFSELVNLTDFRINDNNFTGPIPDFIGNWKQLTRLEMQASGLEGPIPANISLLNNLINLRISDINGPSQGFPLLSSNGGLVTLILRNCNISGNIPPYIWNLKILETLDVSFNKLEGGFPNNISPRSTLQFLFLTGNVLRGYIPSSILVTGPNVDLSYNNFTWQGLDEPACQPNLNLNINMYKSFSTVSALRRVLPCAKEVTCPRYGCSLNVNCGGNDVTVKERNRKVMYEGDASVEGSSASKYFTSGNYWGFSSTGDFMDDANAQNARFIVSLPSPNLSELYRSARVSPLSLTYFQYCLENGTYNVSLHFAEIEFRNDSTYYSLGRRIFDIYIQEKLVWKDFNIEEEARGAQRPVVLYFNASVTDNTLEIRFYWAGKGTTRIPLPGHYGPLVSAISAHPYFKCSNGTNSHAHIYIIVGVAAVCSIIVMFSLLWWNGCLQCRGGHHKEPAGGELQMVTYTLKQIRVATRNFDIANKIGEGGFGPVYKGRLPDGTLIAVKQLSSKSRQGNKEFLNEIGMFSCLQHPNVGFNQLKENLFYIVNILQEYLIGRIVAVPSFMRAILPALESAYFRRIQSSLKVLVLSGETFHLSLWKILVKILPQTAILNLYGSTEVSGDCTYFDCESLPLILEHESLSGVPIGLPLQNCDVLLLGDDDPNEGEICVSGLCLSAGYFCYPSVLPLDYVELSQNHDSKSTDHRVQQYFRTGDFVRKLQNGNFIFLGRKDRTVKISGHRIALEEVENVLREHPKIADAAVIFRNEKRDTSLLEAHLIMKENNEHVEILRSITNWIARKLPPAMIPVRFFFTESFPMSSSGKVDYNLLANSCVCNAGFHSEVDETQDIDLIQAIEKAFCDGLRVDKISHNADFFEMGGNSISAAYVSYTLGINMKDLYTFPTPKKLQMALLRKEISFNHDLRSGASEGVNYEGKGNSNILSLYSREPHHNRRMPLNENSFKRLKMDSNLYIESNYVSASDYSHSNLDLINCSFSRCNYVKHGEECGGNICDSVRSQEFPCGRKISIREFWKVDMESCVDASPLVVYKESNVYVFIGSHSHKFVCIDAKSGVVQWIVELQGRIECSAAIVGDFSQVVVGCYDGNIYFLNFSNGSTHWSYQTCGEVKSQPVVDKPRHLVWCGSHDHNLYALDYKNYCCIFKIPCGGSVFGSPAVDEMQGKLYVASTSGRVTAVSIKAQLYSVLWIKELGVPVFGSLSINFSYEIVICCLVDGSVLALDASGSVVWKGRTGGPIFAGPCTSHTLPSQVLICSRDGIIYSFDLENGKLLWKHSVEDPITASAYVDESLLLSCDDHTLPRRFICVCTSSGGIRLLQVNLDHNEAAKQSGEDVIQEFAKLDLEGDIFSSPVMIGGTIFVGCRDDYVHCLKLER